MRGRRRETLAGRGTAASVTSPASPKSASAPHRSNCSEGGGPGAALALTGLLRAVGFSGIEGMADLRGMVWIQMPISYGAQGMAIGRYGSAATVQSSVLQPPAMLGSRPLMVAAVTGWPRRGTRAECAIYLPANWWIAYSILNVYPKALGSIATLTDCRCCPELNIGPPTQPPS